MYVCKIDFKFRQSIFRFERNIDQREFVSGWIKIFEKE